MDPAYDSALAERQRSVIVAALVHRAQELAELGAQEPALRDCLWEQSRRIEDRVNLLTQTSAAPVTAVG